MDKAIREVTTQAMMNAVFAEDRKPAIKSLFFETILEAYPEVCAIQEPGGRFRNPKKGYIIYEQYAGYYFAYLYSHPAAGNRYSGDPDTLARAVAGWDFYAAQVLPGGKVPIVTFDKYWSDAVDEWGFYYWLQTLDLIGGSLDGAKRSFWESRLHWIGEALKVQVETHFNSENFRKEIEAGSVANHFVWQVLALYRYGVFLGDQGIRDRARVVMERIIEAQLPCGTWLEGGTAVVGYGEVTCCAISLFELLDAHEPARAAIRRALTYVLNATYPGFRKNDCIEGRYWYSERLFAYTAPSFYRYAEGRAYLTKWIQYFAGKKGTENGLGQVLQGLAVVTDLTAVLPEDEPADFSESLLISTGETNWPELKAIISRQFGWTATRCGLKPVSRGSRWVFERQNLVSLFHKDHGLLIGGGHSIGQPCFSTFNVISGGNVYYLHEECDVTERGLKLRYHQTECEVSVELIDSETVHLTCRVAELQQTERVIVHLPLWIAGLGRVAVDGVRHGLGENGLNLVIPEGGSLEYGNAALQLSHKANLIYPVDGYSPYVQNQEGDSVNRRQAVLKMTLYPWQKEAVFTLKLKPL